jgi:glycosyltransferase involved in cell wall biosynthesis
MRVALVHDWLVAHRGGEAVLLELARLFPEAPIYTLVLDRPKIHLELQQRDIRTSYIQRLPGSPASFRRYLPIFPHAIEQFDLSSFDLVVSTSHCVAKGVVTGKAQHLSYVHTPMRYIWDQRKQYQPTGLLGTVVKPAFEVTAAALRVWDKASAKRPDRIIANSNFVAERIRRSWGREAGTVYPPVDTEFFTPGTQARKDYLAVVGAQVGYKNTALAVDLATREDLDLKVVGSGPAVNALKKHAGPTVSFVGHVSNEELREVYREAKGLLFCGVEDFGIVPAEAISCGCPVVAFAAGGALETVGGNPGQPVGVLFTEPTTISLGQAVARLDSHWRQGVFDSVVMQGYAKRFSREAFCSSIKQEIQTLLSTSVH